MGVCQPSVPGNGRDTHTTQSGDTEPRPGDDATLTAVRALLFLNGSELARIGRRLDLLLDTVGELVDLLNATDAVRAARAAAIRRHPAGRSR